MDHVDHVVVQMGQQEEVYGTVESTPRGLRYHPETPEQRKYLVGLIADLRYGQDPTDGALYRQLPPDEFLRLPHRFTGFHVWAALVEDSRGQQQTSEDVERGAEAFWADPRIQAKMRELKRGAGG
jgi:hypothetical protein